MADNVRGSKNLGLIKAIHPGVNPPLNKEIIWFDKNVGQKIHKVYNYDLSQWVPLGGGNASEINGIYTYLAYATDCEGANFALEKQGDSTHIAIITSSTAIEVVDLLPELFEGRWIKFCSAGGDSGTGGNFTYIGYADDENGENFALTPSYEVECTLCEYIDTYTPLNPEDVNYTVTPATGGINIDIDDVAPKTVIIDLKKGGVALTPNINYFVQVTIPASWSSKFFVRLDENEVGGFWIEPDGTNKTFEFLKENKSSQLIIEFYDIDDRILNDTIFVKVGTAECSAPEPELCTKMRSCFALLISDEAIAPENLTVDKFEGLWFCLCCNNSNPAVDGEIANIKQLIQSLINAQNDSLAPIYDQLADLLTLIENLQIYVDQQIAIVTANQTEFETTINGALVTINTTISNLSDQVDNLDDTVQDILDMLSEPTFTNNINSIIAQYLIDNPPGGDGEPYDETITVPSGTTSIVIPDLTAWTNYYTHLDSATAGLIMPAVVVNKKKRVTIIGGPGNWKLSAKSGEGFLFQGASVTIVPITDNQVIEAYSNGSKWVILNIY